ncbi:MAG: phosphoribosyltransferase family protein [Patescibacteria group bacterium]
MKDALTLLKEAGAILEGHFVGVSGRHLSVYVNKDAFLPHTAIVSELARMMAESNKQHNIDIVVGPAVGGIPLSTWTAHHLSKLLGREVLSVFTEKTPEGGQMFKRGYDQLVSGKNVLAVEDTVTTGGSIKSTIEAIQKAGGNVVGLTLIINRDPTRVNTETFGVPMNALAELNAESYGEDEVPEWLKKIPINTTVGHGAKYLKEHPNV